MVRLDLARKSPRLEPRLLGELAQVHLVESEVLRGNPWGDPSTREVGVLLPPSGRTEGRPLILHLPGYMGSGWMEFGRRSPPFQEDLLHLFDRLQRTGEVGEAVVVAPDAMTLLGGSQYVNSTATGRYADHVLDEVLPWAREKFRTGATGVMGQSSGGFGALHLAMERPGAFQAVGTSAGDMAFESTFPHDFLAAAREYRRVGGPEKFLGRFLTEPGVVRGPFHPTGSALLTLAMAACYSPRDDRPGEFELPFDPGSGELEPGTWSRWLRFDPLVRVGEEPGREALRRLDLLHITASRGDEWFLDVAACAFVARARRGGVKLVHEEFDGGHFDRNPRFEALFRRMVAALEGRPLADPGPA